MPTSGLDNLIVPIQVNALYVAAGQTVMDAKADFSRLPWTDGTRDHHPDAPFLGETVLSPAFQNKNFTMAVTRFT